MSPRRKTEPLFPVQEARLPNGLRVRMVPDHDAPVVSLYTFFQVGSRNERTGITGISHLFEHMMFNGAAKYGPKEFDEVLESSGGRSNAYTTHDVTVYYEDFAAEALDTVLDLESDRMRSLTIDDRSLRSEREVVKEERRLRVDNEPAGLMDEALHALVYEAHPYRWPVIGWMGDIEAIRREDCEAYFRTFYAPNNATLWVAGDFEPREVEKARNNLRAHLLREFTSNSGRAHALGTYELFLGSWQHGFGLPEAFGCIDAARVQAAAKRWLDPTQRSVVTLVPEFGRTCRPPRSAPPGRWTWAGD